MNTGGLAASPAMNGGPTVVDTKRENIESLGVNPKYVKSQSMVTRINTGGSAGGGRACGGDACEVRVRFSANKVHACVAKDPWVLTVLFQRSARAWLMTVARVMARRRQEPPG